MSNLDRARVVAQKPGLYPVLESIGWLGLVLALGARVFPESPGFLGWTANPLVFVVLAGSARYGLVPGLATATLALCVHLAMVLKTTTSLAGFSLLGTAHLGTPILLLGCAWFTGLFTERRRELLGVALAAHDRQRLYRERLSTQYTLLSDEKFLLDKQVLSADETFEETVRLFDELERLRPGKFPKRILELTLRLLGGGRAGLYRVMGSKDATVSLVRATSPGWAASLSLETPMIKAALEKKELVSLPKLKGWLEPAVFRDDPIHLACPLAARWRGRPLLVIVKGLPMSGFSTARVRALRAGLTVMAHALKRAQDTHALRERVENSALARLSSRLLFSSRLESELAAARGRQQKVQLVEFRWTPGTKDSVRAALRRHLRKTLLGFHATGQLVIHRLKGGVFNAFCPAGGSFDIQQLIQIIRDAEAVVTADRNDAAGPVFSISVIEMDPTRADPAGGDHGG